MLLALVLLAPLIVMTDPLPSTFFPFIVGKALYARTLIEIAFGLWLILILRFDSHRTPRSWLIVIFAAYTLAALLASVFGVSPIRSLWSTYERMQGWVDLVHWLAFTVVLTSVFRSWDDWRLLLNFNLGISMIMGALGVSQHLDSGLLPFLQGSPRVDITLGNSTYVGAYMLLNVIIAAGLLGRSFITAQAVEVPRAVERRRRRARSRATRDGDSLVSMHIVWRVYWITAILLDGWILYLSGTRGALVGLMAAVVAFSVGYLFWGDLRRVRTAALALLIALWALVLVLFVLRYIAPDSGISGSRNLFTRVASTGLKDRSLEGRIISGVVGLEGFASRPILGWGPENFAIAYDRHVSPKQAAAEVTSFDQAHNKIIEELVTKGLLGFAGYMGLWLYALFVYSRKVKTMSSADRVFTLSVGAALVGYFVQNLFLFDTPGTGQQFYLLLGYVVFVETLAPAADEARAGSAPTGDSTPAGASGAPALAWLRSDAGLIVSMVVTTVFLAVTIYSLNVRPYRASQAILRTQELGISVAQRLDAFDKSISTFRPLANYPRIVMFARLTKDFGDMTDEEARLVLDAAEREARDGTATEPEEWRVYNAVAGLYQTAAVRNPAYAEKARDMVDAALRVAPTRVEVQQLLVRQLIGEENYNGARAAINSYVRLSPNALRHFLKLLELIQAREAADEAARENSRSEEGR